MLWGQIVAWNINSNKIVCHHQFRCSVCQPGAQSIRGQRRRRLNCWDPSWCRCCFLSLRTGWNLIVLIRKPEECPLGTHLELIDCSIISANSLNDSLLSISNSIALIISRGHFDSLRHCRPPALLYSPSSSPSLLNQICSLWAASEWVVSVQVHIVQCATWRST